MAEQMFSANLKGLNATVMDEVFLTVLKWRKNGRRILNTIQNKKSEECDHDFHTTQMSVQIQPLTLGLSPLLCTVNRNL